MVTRSKGKKKKKKEVEDFRYGSLETDAYYLLSNSCAKVERRRDEILAREKAFERDETRGHKTERRGYIYIYILTYLRGKFDYGGGGLVVTERLRKGERSWNWLFEIRSNETRPLERLKVFCNVYVRSVQRYTEVVKLAERKSTNLADDCRR